MGTSLKISQVRIHGTDVPHEWTFPSGVTVIVGGVGGGKTSLLNLIEFGLGGSPTLTSEVRGAGQGVTLEVVAGSEALVLSRNFGRNIVRVLDETGTSQEFSVQNGQQRPWLAERLLAALGVPAVEVPRSRNRTRARSHELVAISFLDVLAYWRDPVGSVRPL